MFKIRELTQLKTIKRIEKLGEKRNASSIEELSWYLWNGDKIVSRYAAWALTQVRDPKGIDILLERLGEEHDLDLELLVEYLGEVSDIAFRPLMNALKNGNRWTRREAAFFLGEVGSKKAIKPLLNALDDEYGYVNHEIKEALIKHEMLLANSCKEDDEYRKYEGCQSASQNISREDI